VLREFWAAAVAIDRSADNVDEKNMPLYRSGDLSQLWAQGGLEHVHEQPLETALRFSSFSDYWEPFLLGRGQPAPTSASLTTIDRTRSGRR
jgi:hypothetical protein